MPKLKSIYICQNCQATSSQWVGQCPQCHEWNTFIEDVVSVKPLEQARGMGGKSLKPINLSDVITKPVNRLSSKISEFDRVLGGGFVPGQVVLLGGAPGIGKSTLLTEISSKIDKKVLYVCGEESVDQVKIRALRMGYRKDNLLLLSQTNADDICQTVEDTHDLGLVIVDSIQTLYSGDLRTSVGSISQIKGCTQLMTMCAKKTGIPFVLVGHITKEGVVAGPKLVEHVVDTVLYLEGDSQHMYRLLRTEKNRFGPVSEVGIFEMNEGGMREVKNPSEMFLSERDKKSSGSCVTVVMEGFRPLLFEIQALSVKTSFGYPKRTTSGYNNNRLQVLIAILERRAGISLANHDVYLSVAGGFKVSEYASDLAVCLALASSLKDKPLKAKLASFGECGLGGEIRRVSQIEKRVSEAKKLGFTQIISPENAKTLHEAINLAF